MSNLATATPTDAELDAAIAHLRSLNHGAFLQYVVTVGEFLVARFLGGNLAAIHDQDPFKAHSLQELVTRRRHELAELDLSVSTLRRYLAATEVWHALPAHTRAQLSLENLSRLGVVKEPEIRKKLAHDAAAMQWSSAQMGVAVQEYKQEKRGGKKKTGRKHKPTVIKAAVALHAAARKLHGLHGAASSLGDAHRLEFDAQVAAAMKVLQGLMPAPSAAL